MQDDQSPLSKTLLNREDRRGSRHLTRMDWSDLREELDAWHGAGRTVSLWWRDDDATAPTPALDRLAGLAREHAVTVGLAVIPALAQPSLAPWLESERVEVLQHGWAHGNHAADGQKRAELGAHRVPGVVAAELSKGFVTLRELAGARFLPVLVPPWNRIDEAVTSTLADVGFRGLSTFGSAPRGAGCAGNRADELPRRRGGLARGTRIRRARSGHRGGGGPSRRSTGAVGGPGRADRAPHAPRGARGVDVDVYRRVHGFDQTASGRALARTERRDDCVRNRRSGCSLTGMWASAPCSVGGAGMHGAAPPHRSRGTVPARAYPRACDRRGRRASPRSSP